MSVEDQARTYKVLYDDSGTPTSAQELYITAGSGVTLSPTRSGTRVTLSIAASGGGGGAPTGASYVVLGTNGSLTHERVLTEGHGIDLVDAGAGSTITVDVDETELDLALMGGTLPVASGGTGASSASMARTNLGLVIGTDVQAYDAQLAAIAALAPSAGDLTYWTSSTAAAQLALGVPGEVIASNAGRTAPVWVEANTLEYGDGSDGNATLDGVAAVAGCSLSGTEYTATRDLFIDTATMSDTISLRPAGYIVRIRKLVGPGSGMAYIHDDGNDASGSTAGGSLGSTNSTGRLGSAGGGSRNSAAVGNNGSSTGGNSIGSAGGAGGAGGGNAGGSAGSATAAAATLGSPRGGTFRLNGRGTTGVSLNGGSGGGGGGYAAGGTLGYSGPGGGGAGVLIVCAAWITNAARITFSADGGNGGNASTSGGTGAKGGGGGGGGGFVLVCYVQTDAALTTSVAGGALGTGVDGGVNGSAGTNGTAITIQGA